MSKGSGRLLARRLSEMRMLRLSTGRSRFHALHPRQSHSLQTRLSQVIHFNFIQFHFSKKMFSTCQLFFSAFKKSKFGFFMVKMLVFQLLSRKKVNMFLLRSKCVKIVVFKVEIQFVI